MKEIIKERTVTEKYTVYEAVDGTQFDFKEDCEKYDNSARGVLFGRLKSFIVNDEYTEWGLLKCGSDDDKVLAISVPSEEAINTILQCLYLDQPWILKDSGKDYRERIISAVNQAYKEQDIIFFGLNCENDLYIIDTRNNIIGRLNNLDKKEEKE